MEFHSTILTRGADDGNIESINVFSNWKTRDEKLINEYLRYVVLMKLIGRN